MGVPFAISLLITDTLYPWRQSTTMHLHVQSYSPGIYIMILILYMHQHSLVPLHGMPMKSAADESDCNHS